MTRLEWTDPAVADLENIQDYVARDSPEYAESLIERLITSVDKLARFRLAGVMCPRPAIQKSVNYW